MKILAALVNAAAWPLAKLADYQRPRCPICLERTACLIAHVHVNHAGEGS